MKDWLVSLTWWIERQACRLRNWLDPEPEPDWPTVTVTEAEWDAAYRQSMRDLAKYADPRA